MLFSQHLVEIAKFVQGLSDEQREKLMDEVTATDHQKRDLLELLLDQAIRDRVLTV